MVDKQDLQQKMVGKWSIKPSLAEKLVDILEFVVDKDEFTTEQIVSHFGFNATTAKRYLRQLTEFGYLEPHGGNKNRTYSKKASNWWTVARFDYYNGWFLLFEIPCFCLGKFLYLCTHI